MPVYLVTMMNAEYKKYFYIADMIIEVTSPIPFYDGLFCSAVEQFEVEKPQKDVDLIKYNYHFGLPTHMDYDGKVIFDKGMWYIIEKEDKFCYFRRSPDKRIIDCIEADKEYKIIDIYRGKEKDFYCGDNLSLLTFASDMIIVAMLLSKRQGFYIHSSAVKIKNSGFIFAGHSGAGKTTILKMLEGYGTVLCDDRNIVRKQSDGAYRLYGSWNHSSWDNVSSESAPLRGVFLIHQAEYNKIEKITDKQTCLPQLLSLIIKPVQTSNWWNDTLAIADDFISGTDFYNLYFNLDEKICDSLLSFVD